MNVKQPHTTNSKMTKNVPLKRTRNKLAADKKEIRLIVKRELYDLVAEHAARYGETANSFVRHLMIDRVSLIERTIPEGSTSTILALFRQFTDLVYKSINNPKDAEEFQKSVNHLFGLVKKHTS